MANISGNPVWKDYPDTTTLIDAEALNNLETGLNNAATTAEWAKLTGVPTAFAPTAHAGTHATGGADPITPASIGAAAALYESGLRNLDSLVVAGSVVGSRLERVGQFVEIYISDIDLTGVPSSTTILTLPEGYRPRFTRRLSSSAGGYPYLTNSGELKYSGSPGSAVISGSWLTPSPPAETKPGTPA